MNNPPAFPQSIAVSGSDDIYSSDQVPGQAGMTLRDYFAAKAMQSLLLMTANAGEIITDTTIARDSYRITDAMLKAREK